MFKTLVILPTLFILNLISAAPVFADTFDKAYARQVLLALTQEIPKDNVVVDPAPTPGSRQEAFLKFYREEIVPVKLILKRAQQESMGFNVLIDAALYENEVERNQWKAEMLKAEAVGDNYASSPAWEAKQMEWGRLAEGLNGELADYARQVARRLEFDQYPASAEALLNEQSRLNQDVDQIANTSPFIKITQQNEKQIQDLELKFFNGEISFFEAAAAHEKLRQDGVFSYGEDVFNRAGPMINRIAQIKTMLAKTKGYQTQADFALASQAESHDPRFQGKENLLKMLYGILDSTDQAMRRFLAKRAIELAGKNYEELRPSQSSFLGLKPYLQIAKYFPAENLVEIWKKTMNESGFSSDLMNRILVDAYPRDLKYSHAYMSPLQIPSPNTLTIDGRSLDLKPSTSWSPALIYIMQNFNKDGLEVQRTGLHEGGHALDYSSKRDPLGHPTSYGLIETHSMTMEYFNEDKEYLVNNGKTRDGEQLSLAEVDKYLQELAEFEISSFRFQVTQAIFDIEVWDYDYESGAQTYTERSLELYKKLNKRYNFLNQPLDVKPVGYSTYTTVHFRSGSVRYYGYILAKMAAAAVANKLSGQFETTTGRNSLYQQPELSKLLTDGLYAKGMYKAFPLQIEDFTGKTYSPKVFTDELIQGLEALTNPQGTTLDNCGNYL